MGANVYFLGLISYSSSELAQEIVREGSLGVWKCSIKLTTWSGNIQGIFDHITIPINPLIKHYLEFWSVNRCVQVIYLKGLRYLVISHLLYLDYIQSYRVAGKNRFTGKRGCENRSWMFGSKRHGSHLVFPSAHQFLHLKHPLLFVLAAENDEFLPLRL